MYGVPYRWTLDVHDGRSLSRTSSIMGPTVTSVATVLAEAVPGVTTVTVASDSSTTETRPASRRYPYPLHPVVVDAG
jgi:hypothetical protein